MYKNMTARFDRLIRLCELNVINSGAIALATEIRDEVLENIQLAYGLAYNDQPDEAMECLEDMLTQEECDAGRSMVTAVGPYIIRDDTYGFIMHGAHSIPLSYASVDDALEEIRGWFSEQSDTRKFSVIEYETNEVVGGHDRSEFEDEVEIE